MKRLRFSRRMVVVCVVLCALLLWYGFSKSQAGMARHTNAVLSSRGLPVLPARVKAVHCWAGGIFAKYMNVKFTASADQALDYLRRAGAQCYFEFEIQISDKTEYHIVATHPLVGSPGTCHEVGLLLLVQRGFCAKPWFRSIYNTRHGWYYYSEDWPATYHMYYDVDSQQFYVYWRYS